MLFDELKSSPSEGKIRRVVEKWWSIYEHNKKIGINHLVIVLLDSAGIKHESVDMTSFPDEYLKRSIYSKDHDLSKAPISDQQFSKAFNKFLDILLQKNFWAIIQDLSFIFDLVSVIVFMKGSLHDSVRAVSYLLAMKIFRQSYNCSGYLMNAIIPDKTTMVGGIEMLKNKSHDNFRYSMRDQSAHLRMIPLKELFSWSEENPDDMIEEGIRKYILRGLSDSFLGNRRICLNIFGTIFAKPSVFNKEKQQDLFNRLIPELNKSLRSNEELDYLILKIVNQASKFLYEIITPEEDFNFSMCLFSGSESVIDEAKTYFYRNHFKEKTGVNIISETCQFYRKSSVKNASKLVKNFVSLYAAHTTWQDWEFCLKSSFENDVYEYLNIFYLYVCFLNGSLLSDLDSSTINKMKDGFSVYFSECWLQLMETDKITMNSNAQVLMLKLAASFNVLKLFRETQVKIINWCLKNFHQCRNHEVLKECLFCINFLNSFNKNIEIEKMLISQVLTEFIELLKRQNVETEVLNLSHYKVNILIKIYEDSSENMCESLLYFLEKERDFEKVQFIISTLYHLVLNKIKKFLYFNNNSEISENDLNTEENSFQNFMFKAKVANCCAIVIQAASNFIYNTSQHIDDYDNLEKFMLIPKLYGDMIRLWKNPQLSELFLELPDTNPEPYAIYCSQIMNTDCQRKGPTPLSSCCVLLNDYVELTMEGKICISYLKFFFMNFHKLNSHWLILLNFFNFLINVKNNPIGAYAMVNGLISFHNKEKEKFVDESTIKAKLSEVTTFIFNNLSNKEGKSYQTTVLHLCIYLEKLVKEGYIIFIEVMEKIKSYLSEEIKIKLMSENPCIQL